MSAEIQQCVSTNLGAHTDNNKHPLQVDETTDTPPPKRHKEGEATSQANQDRRGLKRDCVVLDDHDRFPVTMKLGPRLRARFPHLARDEL